ncbi:MAG TPA: electron transfer flavoprotein subunit alpha/FixB family protein [Acidimicrobiales bacterium]|nr:electron transfer flavoprotein subunit alpha/FixB family protein [Acidimicrobiales bacterium]
MSANPVLCLVEQDDEGVIEASRRALSVANSFAATFDATLVAVLIGDVASSTLASLSRFAVSSAWRVTWDDLDVYAPVAWARALTDLAAQTSASAVVAAGTDRGNEVLAHAGALANLPMVANCFSASRVDSDTVALSRQRWAGSLLEDATLTSPLALLTVAFDGVTALEVAEPHLVPISEFRAELDPADLAVRVADWTKRPGGISLAEAKVVVGGGRGVGSAEAFASLDELAGLLNAAVGVSRAVTSLGWRSHSQQVGQTGTRISPDLYLAAGISGATQHLAGCQSAKIVVAINTDADAPIVSRADYAIIGDLNAIVPALVTAIRAR